MARAPSSEKIKIKLGFGKVMRECRTARGLSQAKLAEMASVDRSYISQVETGEHSPTITMLWGLARVLEVSPSALITSLEQDINGRDLTRFERRQGK